MFGWAAHDGTSWVLGLIFVGIGVLKATNSNALMRSKFDNYATVFPLNELAPHASPDATACDGSEFPVCCPVTKLCVKAGQPCSSPCAAKLSN